MREIKKIIVHCSDSDFGDADLIDLWHRQRGFSKIGYHHILLNGCRSKDNYRKEDDGKIETGRLVEEIGAHCEGQNSDSIGICLIGKRNFSALQLYVALPHFLKSMQEAYGIVSGQVFGHYEFNADKTCPNINMQILKDAVWRLA